MNLKDLEALAPGSIVKVIDDGKLYHGHAGQLRRISDKGNAGLLILGRLVWINPERLVKNG